MGSSGVLVREGAKTFDRQDSFSTQGVEKTFVAEQLVEFLKPKGEVQLVGSDRKD